MRRWNSSEGTAVAARIIELLQARQVEEALELAGGHEGRSDLRGLDFGRDTDRHQGLDVDVNGHRMTFVRSTRLTGLHLESVDLSSANLRGTVWEDCTFKDCLFAKSRVVNSRFFGCTIKESRFESSQVKDTLLCGSNDNSLGSLENVEFIEGKFSDVGFGHPVIAGCRFRCDMKRVDFHGSRLKESVFEGELDGVIFRGKAIPFQSDSYAIGREIPVNRMENVDFSKATLEDVEFRDGVDLTKCVLPAIGEIFLIRDGPHVFSEALKIIETEWSGDERRIAMDIIRDYYLVQIKKGQTQFLFKGYLWAKSFGKHFANRLATLLRSLE